jgi:ATP-binding cassette, subfamily B, multidrug efflux pump
MVKVVLSFLKPYRMMMTIAWLLMLIELAVELWQPLLMAKIIDEGIIEQNLSVVISWGSVMIGISLLAFGAGITNSFFASYVSQNFSYDVRKGLFQKVQAFSFSNFLKFPTSSLITRLTNDVTQVQNTIFMSLRILMRAPLLVVFGTVMALFVHVKLALILLTTIPFLFLFIVWTMKKGSHLFKSVQRRLDRVNGVMRENLNGMRLIKAFVQSKHEVKRFNDTNQKLMDRTIYVLRLVESITPILLFVMNIAIVIILAVGSFEVNNGALKVGEVVAIVNYAFRITSALSMITFIVMALTRAHASAQRISEIFDTKSEMDDSENEKKENPPINGEITFQQVSFKYPTSNTYTLTDLTFHINPKETVAVLGSTGSGKTTFIQLIPRLYDVTNGNILIDTFNIKDLNQDYLRKQIGYVPQDVLLFSGSIKENISWGKENCSMDEIIAAAKDAQIHETIMNLPNQYETIVGQKGVNLSGGQKQRISIARALVRKPKILLLDDSTSALDLKTEAQLLNAIRKYDCTTIIITQKINTAKIADKIFLFDHGRIVAEGSHEQLITSNDLYKQIVQSQQRKEVVFNGETSC